MQNIVREDIIIAAAARTPIGRFNGNLRDYTATDLAGVAIKGLLDRTGLDPAQVDTVNLGNVVHAGHGMAGAKAAAVKGGLPENVCARCVDSVCGSGLDAVVIAIESLLVGSSKVAIAGGMESRSTAPYLLGPRLNRAVGELGKGSLPKMKRAGAYRWAFDGNEAEQLKGLEIKDATTYDGLFWAPDRKFMREYALTFIKEQGYGVSLINEHASRSHAKAEQAVAAGWFEREIVPCGEVAQDQLLSGEAQQRALSESPDDPASSYNSSVPGDNAAVVLVTSRSRAEELALEPMARVLGYCRVDCPAPEFLTAPVEAHRRLKETLEQAGKPSEFELIEANEAFACQLPYFEEHFGAAQVNVHGGAVALGHPLGAAGARLLTTLLFAMQTHNKSVGLVTLCFGGGGAVAMAVERLS
ncbi:MAG: thiolase family protein [Armatimonadetes bacterium]|nr:thiolase family protein [Armatimonadota bacterium]